ncbi:hypothetical protein [Streptomyces coeruleoprunus]
MHQRAEKPKTGKEGTEEKNEKNEKKRIDLSVAQVAGTAIAAVVAATLASRLGVYGTVLGAGVISVIATCGGSVFQYLFASTGERFHGAAARTSPAPAQPPHPDGTFGEATTYRSRVRGWKRSVAAAALVFVTAMAGITAYEVVSGRNLSGDQGSTTFGSVVGAGGGQERPSTPAPSRGGDHGDGRTGKGGQEATPGSRPGIDGSTAPATPSPTPSTAQPTTGAPTPTPTPTPPPTPTPDPATSPADPPTAPEATPPAE